MSAETTRRRIPGARVLQGPGLLLSRLLGRRSISRDVDLAPQKIERRLSSALGRPRRIGRERGKPFVGRAEEGRFWIARQTSRNSFATHLRGQITPGGNGSLVQAQFTMNRLVSGLLTFWFLLWIVMLTGWTAAVVGRTITGNGHAVDAVNLLFIAGIGLVAAAVLGLSRVMDRRGQQEIETFLDSVLYRATGHPNPPDR